MKIVLLISFGVLHIPGISLEYYSTVRYIRHTFICCRLLHGFNKYMFQMFESNLKSVIGITRVYLISKLVYLLFIH